jgi:hypothetical protein
MNSVSTVAHLADSASWPSGCPRNRCNREILDSKVQSPHTHTHTHTHTHSLTHSLTHTRTHRTQIHSRIRIYIKAPPHLSLVLLSPTPSIVCSLSFVFLSIFCRFLYFFSEKNRKSWDFFTIFSQCFTAKSKKQKFMFSDVMTFENENFLKPLNTTVLFLLSHFARAHTHSLRCWGQMCQVATILQLIALQALTVFSRSRARSSCCGGQGSWRRKRCNHGGLLS